MKKHNHKNRSRKASALLVTILIMGILLVLTLGLSRLVIADLRSTNDLVVSGKAYYAAEAGIESALLELHQNLSGHENPNGERLLTKQNEQELKANYTIENQTQIFPHINTEEISESKVRSNPHLAYSLLPLNQSITIPLFIIEEENDTKSVKNIENFRIEYFVSYKDGSSELIRNGIGNKINQDDVDVLRWKIFGLNDQTFKTESISDYFPVKKISSATKPMCLGTRTAITSKPPASASLIKTECGNTNVDASIAREYYEQKGDKTIYYSTDSFGIEQFTQNIKRPKTNTPQQPTSPNPATPNPSAPNPNAPADLDPKDDNSQNKPPEDKVLPGGYSIDEFLRNHKNNYITLTNIINPDIILAESESVRKAIANIYYRVVVFDNKKTVREYATIRSQGKLGDTTQTIEAKIRMDQFLPVFNFSLYRTNTERKN